MNKFLLIALSLLFIFSSCKKDEALTMSNLDGLFDLELVYGTLQGLNLEYNVDEVTWEFDSINEKLYVKNNIDSTGPEDIYAGLETGTYNFIVVEDNLEQILYINNKKECSLSLTQLGSEDSIELILDYGLALDDVAKRFKKR